MEDGEGDAELTAAGGGSAERWGLDPSIVNRQSPERAGAGSPAWLGQQCSLSTVMSQMDVDIRIPRVPAAARRLQPSHVRQAHWLAEYTVAGLALALWPSLTLHTSRPVPTCSLDSPKLTSLAHHSLSLPTHFTHSISAHSTHHVYPQAKARGRGRGRAPGSPQRRKRRGRGVSVRLLDVIPSQPRCRMHLEISPLQSPSVVLSH